MKIKVLLVEDGEEWGSVFQAQIKKCVRAELTECAKSRRDAIVYLSQHTVDIIILDLDKGEFIKDLKQVSNAKIVVITPVGPVKKDLFSMGISAYLYKNQLDILCGTIEAVYDGTYTYEALFKEYNKYKIKSELAVLTTAEKAILKFLLGQETITEISTINHVAESTVKKQINSIYRKLEIHRNGAQQREKLRERYLSALEFL